MGNSKNSLAFVVPHVSQLRKPYPPEECLPSLAPKPSPGRKEHVLHSHSVVCPSPQVTFDRITAISNLPASSLATLQSNPHQQPEYYSKTQSEHTIPVPGLEILGAAFKALSD